MRGLYYLQKLLQRNKQNCIWNFRDLFKASNAIFKEKLRKLKQALYHPLQKKTVFKISLSLSAIQSRSSSITVIYIIWTIQSEKYIYSLCKINFMFTFKRAFFFAFTFTLQDRLNMCRYMRIDISASTIPILFMWYAQHKVCHNGIVNCNMQ